MSAALTPFEAAPRLQEWTCWDCRSVLASERVPVPQLCDHCLREHERRERYWDEDDRGLYDREDA